MVSKHRRGRWSQFRLRTLLLATSTFGIVLAALTPLVESYRHEWRVYHELCRLPYTIQAGMEPSAPAWLRPFGADRFMRRLVSVQFYDCDDDSLALVAGLPALQAIEVRSKRVTDRGLKHLEQCGQLLRLALDCPNLSDAMLEPLQRLQNLRSLTLKSPLISNDGLKNVSELDELRQLIIDAPKVSDDGMRHLGGLALRELRIAASITDRGLRHLLSRQLPWSPDEPSEPQLLVCVPPGKESLVQCLGETTDANFDEQPLYNVLEYVCQRHPISISTREELREAGIDPLIPITINTPVAGRTSLPGYRLYDLLGDLLQPVGLDWKLGTATDLEVVPLKKRATESPNLLKFRAAWPKCMVIVDW